MKQKILHVLEQVEEGIAHDNQPDDEPPTPINSEELKERIAKTNRERLSKEEKNRLKHWKKNIYQNYRNTKIILIY